jgi:hypothetical protein
MPNPKMSKASKMVKRFMPNCHYQKGKELGNNLQGIFAPVELPSTDERFGRQPREKKGGACGEKRLARGVKVEVELNTP